MPIFPAFPPRSDGRGGITFSPLPACNCHAIDCEITLNLSVMDMKTPEHINATIDVLTVGTNEDDVKNAVFSLYNRIKNVMSDKSTIGYGVDNGEYVIYVYTDVLNNVHLRFLNDDYRWCGYRVSIVNFNGLKW